MGIISELNTFRGLEINSYNSVELKVDSAISRIKRINFFPGVIPPDQEMLQKQSDQLLQRLGFSNLPARIITNLDEGTRFLAAVRSTEWRDVWESIKETALAAKDESGRTKLWDDVRSKARISAKGIDDLRSSMIAGSVVRRVGGFAQWTVVEDIMQDSRNPFEPFIKVNEMGGAILGPAKGEVGILFPQGDFKRNGRF